MKKRIKTPSDNWSTPKDFYDKLNSRFNFLDFDPCPLCNDMEQYDSLSAEPWPVGNIYINPPYNTVDKAKYSWKGFYHYSFERAESVVLLLPVSTSTQLFHQLFIKEKATIEFLEGRLKFEGVDTSGNWVNPGVGMSKLFECEGDYRSQYPLEKYPNSGIIKRSGQFDSMLVIFGDPKS